VPKETIDERYSKWSERIDVSKRLIKNRIDEWQEFLRYYRLDLREGEAPTGDNVWINFQFAYSRIILPSIYYRNPDMNVRPRRKGQTSQLELLAAEVKDDVLNYQFEELAFEVEARRVIFDTLFCGYGVMKFGFAPKLAEQKKVSEITTLDFEALFEEEDEPGVSREGYDDRVRADHPFMLRVAPRYFWVDPLATSLEDARWVIHGILKPIKELQKDRNYPSRLTSGVEGTHRLEEERYLTEADKSSVESHMRGTPMAELVMLYEIWDKENNELLVMDSYNKDQGSREFLKRKDWPYNIEGFPFELLVFNPDPESPLGVSDVSNWKSPAQAINFINSMHYNHVKRFQRKYICEKGMLAEGGEEKLLYPADGMVVEVNGDVDSLKPLQDAPITPDAYALRDVVQNGLVLLSGVTEQKRGAIEKSKTATEASLIDQQARIRDSDRLYVVSKFVERAAKKLLQLDREFLDFGTVESIVGPEKARFWLQDPEGFWKSEVDVKVRVGSSAFVSKEVQAKQYLDLLNLTANLVDPMTGQPLVNVQEIIRRVADKLDIDDYESLLAPVPPPGTLPPGVAPPTAQGGQSPPQSAGGGPVQSPTKRDGAANLGDILSGVQNLGVRRQPGDQ